MRNARFWFPLLLLAQFAAAAAAAGEPDLPALCERVRPAFVFLGGGSGAIISPDGLVLTNDHVISDGRAFGARKGGLFDLRTGAGRHYQAKLLGHDVRGDLALLQLVLAKGETVPCFKLGDSEALRPGDFALAIGNPLAVGLVDYSPTFTAGIVSARNQVHGNYTDALVTDAPINPGNSGGPLVNAQGELVGIDGQIATRWGLRSSTGLGYAISSRQIRIWLPRLKEAKGQEVAHGGIPGVLLDTQRAAKSREVIVEAVGDGSYAARCGLRGGDRITRFEGTPITGPVQLAGLMGMYPEGQEVRLDVDRGGHEVPLRLTLVKTRRGSLGIKLLRPDKDEGHVRIAEVEPGSPAERAGLKKGDEIIAVKGIELDMSAKWQYIIVSAWLRNGVVADDVVVLKVRRPGPGGKPETREIRTVPK